MSKKIVFVCDRCKKELQTPHIVSGRICDSTGYCSTFELHFCHDCIKAINSFISNKDVLPIEPKGIAV